MVKDVSPGVVSTAAAPSLHIVHTCTNVPAHRCQSLYKLSCHSHLTAVLRQNPHLAVVSLIKPGIHPSSESQNHAPHSKHEN